MRSKLLWVDTVLNYFYIHLSILKRRNPYHMHTVLYSINWKQGIQNQYCASYQCNISKRDGFIQWKRVRLNISHCMNSRPLAPGVFLPRPIDFHSFSCPLPPLYLCSVYTRVHSPVHGDAALVVMPTRTSISIATQLLSLNAELLLSVPINLWRRGATIGNNPWSGFDNNWFIQWSIIRSRLHQVSASTLQQFCNDTSYSVVIGKNKESPENGLQAHSGANPLLSMRTES